MQASTIEPGHICQTPHMDHLAASGIRFDRAYTPSPTCSPARASLMTGLLPHNHGVLHVEHTVDPDQDVLRNHPHWAQKLVTRGYRTGYFGKWHIERSNDLMAYGWQVNGAQNTTLYNSNVDGLINDLDVPLDPKFAGYREECDGYDPLRHYGVTNALVNERTTSLPATLAEKFIQSVNDKAEPWCCCVSYPSPNEAMICSRSSFDQYDHRQIDLPLNLYDSFSNGPNLYKRAQQVWQDVSEDEWRMARACYYARISELDEQLGRLISLIEASDQKENTVIIVTSDHGKYVGAHGFDAHNFGAFEEIYRIPLIVSGPGISEQVTTTARVGLHDLGETITSLASAESLGVADSRSFIDVLYAPRQNEGAFTTGFSEYHGTRFPLMQRVVWDGPWKFIWNGFDFDELYHLEKDPYEMNNLASEDVYRPQIHKLTEMIWDRIKETNDHTLLNAHYYSMRFAMHGPDV